MSCRSLATSELSTQGFRWRVWYPERYGSRAEASLEGTVRAEITLDIEISFNIVMFSIAVCSSARWFDTCPPLCGLL